MDAHWETVFHLAADYEVRDVKKGGLACTPPSTGCGEDPGRGLEIWQEIGHI